MVYSYLLIFVVVILKYREKHFCGITKKKKHNIFYSFQGLNEQNKIKNYNLQDKLYYFLIKLFNKFFQGFREYILYSLYVICESFYMIFVYTNWYWIIIKEFKAWRLSDDKYFNYLVLEKISLFLEAVLQL